MSLIHGSAGGLGGAGAPGGPLAGGAVYSHTLNQSLRLDGTSAYLSKNDFGTSTNTSKRTFSTWIKRSTDTAPAAYNHIISAGTSGIDGFGFANTTEKLQWLQGGGVVKDGVRKLRDVSSWYHVFTTWNATDNEIFIYVNGELDYSAYGSINALSKLGNTGQTTYIGRRSNVTTTFIHGYLAETVFLDGTIGSVSDFAETSNGVWVPKDISAAGLTFGDNGFYLDYADSSDLGKDVSGKNNHFTSNSLAAEDQVPDSPTNNWCTNNATMRGNFTHREGALKLIGVGSNFDNMAGTFLFDVEDADGWYWEYRSISNANDVMMGIGRENNPNFNQSDTSSAYAQDSTAGNVGWMGSGDKKVSGTNSSYGDSWTSGDIIGIAVKAGAIYFYKNGSIQNSGTAAATGLTGNVVPAFAINSTYSGTVNYGQDSTFAGTVSAGNYSDKNGIGDFKYSVPSGYKALCASNLPNTAIGPGQNTQADDHFENILYIGNGDEQHIGSGGVQHPQDTISITNSLRFEAGSSAYLSRTQGSSPTNIGKWTVNFWLKRTNVLEASDDYDTVFGVDGPGNTAFTFLNGQIYLFVNYHTNGSQARLITNRKFLDSSRFYNFHVTFDRDASTDAEKLRLYVDGVEETSFATDERSLIASDSSTGWNVGTLSAAINRRAGGQNSRYHNGYIAQFHNIDGAVVAPTEFAQVGANGYWIPKTYSGSYGNNGWLLEFKQTGTGSGATNTVGADTSGNTNHWDSSGIASEDQMIDSPTQNFNTLNTNGTNYIAYAVTLSEGNLKAAALQSKRVNSMFGVTSGKYYFETKSQAGHPMVGVALRDGSDAIVYDGNTGYIRNYAPIDSGSPTANPSTFATWGTSDIIGVAFDVDNDTVQFFKNNTSIGTFTFIMPTEVVATAGYQGGTDVQVTFNFGADDTFAGNASGGAGSADSNSYGSFFYAPPSGHLALVDDNISQEGIASPDFVWIKERNNSTSHYLFDTVRGVRKTLLAGSSGAAAEATDATSLLSFGNQGFTVGSNTSLNGSADTYVSWNWKAGGIAPTQTYVVTVENDGGNKYRFDGNDTNALTLNLQEGGTYTFDQSHPSNAVGGVHPLRFSTTSDGTHGGGSEYTTGVTATGTPGQTGAKTVITVAHGAPTLYYYCTQHSGMGGQANTTATHGSSNFKGSIPAIVSANQDSGFSIVRWTNNGTAGTVGHGLTSTPELITVKNMDYSSGNWYTWTPDLTTNKVIFLNAANNQTSSANAFTEGDITATTIGVGTERVTNGSGSGEDLLAYVFHSVDGFSKMGKYVGNGSSNGTFVYTGFRPAWLLMKTISGADRWVLFDSARSIANPVEDKHELNPSDNTAEGTGTTECFDFLSNGFKLRRTGNVFNTGSRDYIYMAFAESPFKFANAR